jgi:hypothetical protein
MRNEIGSEFWEVPVCKESNSVFSPETRWFLSGRSALQAIIAENNFKTAALPSWCCDSMIKPFTDAGVEVHFYASLEPIEDVSSDVILVMDYFGYSGHSDIAGFKGTIIRDVTHSIFSKSYADADYYFGSLRKWAGFWTGGFVWGIKGKAKGENREYVQLRKTAMAEKSKYIQGMTDSKEYLKVFAQAEELLDNTGMEAADPRDVELGQYLDIKKIKDQRRKNAQALLKEFADIAVSPVLNPDDCPLFVPIRVPFGKRDVLRRYLISKEIYCPVHWPVSSYHQLNKQTRRIYDEELSLVCDQRYTEEDMLRIIASIKEFFKKSC